VFRSLNENKPWEHFWLQKINLRYNPPNPWLY
jgi:hypothetical protein